MTQLKLTTITIIAVSFLIIGCQGASSATAKSAADEKAAIAQDQAKLNIVRAAKRGKKPSFGRRTNGPM